VLTNVPGPGTPIDIEGAEVLRWTASPPQAGKGVLGLGILSYNGHLIWTVTGIVVVTNLLEQPTNTILYDS
jgi:hypothetical protein